MIKKIVASTLCLVVWPTLANAMLHVNVHVPVPISCIDVDRRANELAELKQANLIAVSEAESALRNNNRERARELHSTSAEIRFSIARKEVTLRILRAAMENVTVDLRPNSSIALFLLGGAGLSPHPLDADVWKNQVEFEAIRSAVPVEVVRVVPQSGRFKWTREQVVFRDARSPELSTWIASNLDAHESKWPLEVRFGKNEGCSGSWGACNLFTQTSASILVPLGTYCSITQENAGDLAAFSTTYRFPYLGNTPIRVNYRIGHDFKETSDQRERAKEAENIALDSILSKFLKNVLGRQKIYRVSDAVLKEFEVDGSEPSIQLVSTKDLNFKFKYTKGITLRDAFNKVHAAFESNGSAIEDEDLARHFELASSRYVDGASGVVQFIFSKGTYSVRIGFVRLAGKVRVKEILMNDRVVYRVNIAYQ